MSNGAGRREHRQNNLNTFSRGWLTSELVLTPLYSAIAAFHNVPECLDSASATTTMPATLARTMLLRTTKLHAPKSVPRSHHTTPPLTTPASPPFPTACATRPSPALATLACAQPASASTPRPPTLPGVSLGNFQENRIYVVLYFLRCREVLDSCLVHLSQQSNAAACTSCSTGSFSNSGKVNASAPPAWPARAPTALRPASTVPLQVLSREHGILLILQRSAVPDTPRQILLRDVQRLWRRQVHFRELVDTQCSPCSPGTASVGSLAACPACNAGAGFVAPDSGMTTCIYCGSGTRSDSTFNSCVDCASSKYSNGGQSECDPCPGDSYQDDFGASSC